MVVNVDLDSALADLTSGEDIKAEAAAGKIGKQGSAVIPHLGRLLKDPDPDVRWWAIRALAEIDNPSSQMLLHQALRDPELSVRQCAALALRYQPYPSAIPELIKILADPDRLLAHLAGEALMVIGPQAVPALMDVVQSGVPSARLEATRVLAKIADPRSIPILFELYDGQSALMEYWADEGLERMGVGMVFYKPG